MAVRFSEIGIVESDAPFGAIFPQMIFHAGGECGFRFSGRVIKQPEIRIAFYSIQNGRKAVDGKMENLGVVLFLQFAGSGFPESVSIIVEIVFQKIFGFRRNRRGECGVAMIFIAVAI